MTLADSSKQLAGTRGALGRIRPALQKRSNDWLNSFLGGALAQLFVVFSAEAESAGAKPFLDGGPVPALTNLLQLSQAMWRDRCVCYPVRLDATVLWADAGQGQLFLQDDSAAVAVPLDWRGQPPVRAGQRVRLEGSRVAGQGALRKAVVDNDGLHAPEEKSGTLYLAAGLHTIRADWFNGLAGYKLEIEYSGPGLPRQKIAPTALFRRATTEEHSGATDGLVQGLDYKCYEGNWKRLPEYERLQSIKSGTVAGFDLRVITRSTNVGLQFVGRLELPRDGLYTFWTKSDDGSRLFVGDSSLSVNVLGSDPLTPPQKIALGQVLRLEQESRWSEVEGTVSFVGVQAEALQMELRSGTGSLRVELANGTGASLLMLLNSRIRVTGICQSTLATDGQKVVGVLLVPSCQQIELLDAPSVRWSECPVRPIGQLIASNFATDQEVLAHVRGKVLHNQPGQWLEIEDASGRLLVETGQTTPRPGCLVEALGRWSRIGTNVVLSCGVCRALADDTASPANALPLLMTVDHIKRLDRKEAERGYPVKIRGVVIGVWAFGAFALQDSTRAVYVEWRPSLPGPTPRVGDFWEVEGVTFAGFAPNVRPRRCVRLGPGRLPEPLHPTWDQLSNGSLDTQYVEVQGIITAIESDGVAFLTRSGKIMVQFPGIDPQILAGYQNALIRVRGCLSPRYNVRTQLAQVGQIRLFSASFQMDQPAPDDPFAAPLKHASDLLLFDPQAGAMQRVHITGQVLHQRNGEFYLFDAGSGIRFVPQPPASLAVGDLVEVVGFADLVGPSPVLREAVARRVGLRGWPAAQPLSVTNFLSASYDATLVRASARLVGISANQSEQALELQAGTRQFIARLEARQGTVRGLVPGSLLELTGVYAGRGGNRALGREIDSFELLLNSPQDIRVLKKPSWWTARHTLIVVGSLACVLFGAMVWITLLHRQVQERSLRLAAEIRDHEQTERQRALEADRSRIARDLHDDLGARLSEIILHGNLVMNHFDREKAGVMVARMTLAAQELVDNLDAIVWAVNPKNDSLARFSDYVCEYAQSYLERASIRCSLDVPGQLPDCPVSSEVRHNLFLVTKEALHNVAKHARASNVKLQLQVLPGPLSWNHGSGHQPLADQHVENDKAARPGRPTNGSPVLAITIEDDGQGFSPESKSALGNGLDNMAQRLKNLGGTFDLAAAPGTGTRLRFQIALSLN